MRAVVAGRISLRADDAPARMVEQLWRDLSFPNPEFVTRKRMGRYLGATPEEIECIEQDDEGWVHIPLGGVALLRKRASESGIDVSFEDRRVVGSPLQGAHQVPLRPYQQEALAKMRRGLQGTVLMPCGGGKTVVGVSAIGAIGQPALVLVHTRDLLDQWRETIAIMLALVPGVVAEGQMEIAPVTVATVQTLTRMSEDELAHLGRQFGCVIIDEAHHVPASTFRGVLAHLPGRYRFGLTATPHRDDGLTSLLELCIGPRLFESDQQQLVELGYFRRPEIQPLHTTFTFEMDGAGDHPRCMAALTRDKERNKLIVDQVLRDAANDHTVLVLSGRVEHCRRLARLIRKGGVHAELLVGAVTKDERQRILEAFRKGETRVVVASTVADEGLDVPRLDRVVLAYPTRARGRTTQRLGRLMRPYPGKGTPVLYDVVDPLVPALARQWTERRRLYARLLGRDVARSPEKAQFDLQSSAAGA